MNKPTQIGTNQRSKQELAT